MIQFFPNSERGSFDHGWLAAKFSFSFNTYHNPKRVHYKNLRVLNEDRIQPQGGFGMHSHSDMEIITYVISGEIAHKDSLGHEEIISAGQVQRMSAGTGITHSEVNPSQKDLLHLLQIWIFPEVAGLPPSYETKTLQFLEPTSLTKFASHQPGKNELKIHQKCELYIGKTTKGEKLFFNSQLKNRVFLQVIDGEISTGQFDLRAGDVIYVENEDLKLISLNGPAHFILIDQ